MLRRLLLVLLTLGAFAVMVVVRPTNAYADDPWSTVDCDQTPTAPECTVTVISAGGGDAPSGSGTTGCRDARGDAVPCYIQKWGWLGADGCYYKPVTPELAAALDKPTPPAAWYEGTCVDVTSGVVLPIVRLRVFATPPGQSLLIAEAVRRLRLPAPAIRVNPAPPAAQLLYVPTWLWLDSSSWGARSATASVPGLSVTATAKPVRVVWSTGDGRSVTCDGPGTPWRAGTDPMASSPDCGHTYDTSSGQGTFTLRATITWSVSWVGGGLSGTEPALTSTASVPLKVAESVAVNTSGGG